MISLTTNGRALPSALLAGTPYDVAVQLNGSTPIFVEWTVMSGLTVLSSGNGTPFILQVATPGNVSLVIHAIGHDGNGEESITSIAVSSRRAQAPTLSVRWSSLQASPGETVDAEIRYSDPEGATATDLSWTLYWNSGVVQTGTTKTVKVSGVSPGTYRLRATATDAAGATVIADSTLRVSGTHEVSHSIAPPTGETTFQYLGCLYSDTFTTPETTVSTLPAEIASFDQEVVLLPGTTHVKFVLDGGITVDDEVVIRTGLGNWALVGPPTGLTGESLNYDYTLDLPFLPVPADRRLAYTIDVINTSGAVVAANTIRVKVECYYAANPIYTYDPCPYSDVIGGAGERQRRMLVVVEKLDIDLDAVHQRHRGGADSTVIFTTQIPDRISVTASATGLPCPQQPNSGVMYTEANLLAVYDPEEHSGLEVLEAKGVYGMSGLRPVTFSLSIPREIPVVQRVRRAYGKLALYLAAGGVNEGTTATVRIKTNTAPGYVDYTVDLSDFYNPETDVFEKVGECDIDVADFGFDIGGMTFYVTIND